jgi:hypothetical protein
MYAYCPWHCVSEHGSTWQHCQADAVFISDKASVLRDTAKYTFCNADILDETDTLVFWVIKVDSMSSLKIESACFAVKLATKGRYILEDLNYHVFTLCFGVSSGFI